MKTDNQPEDEDIIEQPDGSVVVGGRPAETDPPAGGSDDQQGDQSHDDDDDDDDDARPVAGGGASASEEAELSRAPDEAAREAIRAARRIERQEKRTRSRERAEQMRARLQQSEQRNQELNERLGLLERKTSGSELAQLDNAIGQAAEAYNSYKAQVGDAVTRQDGEAVAAATERMVIARERHKELSHIRQQYTAAPQKTSPPLDPMLVQLAQKWTSQNTWYDPQGRDLDSRITLALDKSVIDEGFLPNTPAYWAELDKRVQKHLPHRARNSGSGGPERGIVPPTEPAHARPSKTVVMGSGRAAAASNSGSGGFNLSRERVEAMKEAGMWDDPKSRNDMIRQYREYDKANPGRGD